MVSEECEKRWGGGQWQSFFSYIKALFRRGRMEDDLSEELQFHLQSEIEKNIAAGMSPKELATRHCAASAGWTKCKKSVET